ncbi:MAG TPA: ABC transporter ATP-binding protein [Myxococcales bacterium]
MNAELRERVCWPFETAGIALEALAREAGLSTRPAEILPPPPVPKNFGWRHVFGQWLHPASAQLGIESEGFEPIYGEVDDVVRAAAPALLTIYRDQQMSFVLLLRCERDRARVLTRDQTILEVPLEDVSEEVRHEEAVKVEPEVDALLEMSGLAQEKRAAARRAMLAARLDGLQLRQSFVLRTAPELSLWTHARRSRVPHAFFATLACHVAQYILGLAGWWVIGSAGLSGRFEPGWFAAWSLLLLSVVPFRMLELWWQGAFALRSGALLKQRLLQGTLNLHPDEVRTEGAGHHFGKVSESENVESLALSGGLLALLSTVDLTLAGFVLWKGAAGGPQVLALVCWLGLIGVLAVRHFRRQRAWAQKRIDVTHALLERMEGHRTRLAQEAPERWHVGEDELLSDYHGISERLDDSAALIASISRRGFLLVAFAALVPAFVFGSPSITALAISVGGILLASRALEDASQSFQTLTSAATSFEQIRDLLRAAMRKEPQGVLAHLPARGSDDRGKPLMDIRGLGFRYSEHHKPVLDGCDLQIRRGDRLLLEGASGSGKSTLAAILAGLRTPTEGLLLLDGIDRPSLGAVQWQRRITSAPQFHENHVFAGTFSMNLCLGGAWPAMPAEILRAEEICRELGLGPLIDRMPGGLGQMVGETGWQLSHGERSRLYIARTLIQDADLVVLDESFAALDPETLSVALRCVLRRADTLLVIAHP